ncbi:FAD-binding protein [Acetobacter estunensis]|nr:FAD-binding protein [Acetobacter estunensis]
MVRNVNIEALRGQPVIVGAGIAGLLVALHMGEAPCVLVSAAAMSAAGALSCDVARQLGVGETTDTRAELTLRKGEGLASPEVVQLIAGRMEHARMTLQSFGVSVEDAGTPVSNAGLHLALLKAVARRPNITIISPALARRLVLVDEQVRGLVIASGEHSIILGTDAVIMAGGGAGGLYGEQLLPPTSVGTGLALAARAGAVLADPELVWFHPFALSSPATAGTGDTLPLGLCTNRAVLFDEQGQRVEVASSPEALSRTIFQYQQHNRAVFLDLRRTLANGVQLAGSEIDELAAACRRAGIDPQQAAIPVRAAAAFHIGGVRATPEGVTSLAGLWACGESACTGFHGAAIHEGNPLLEAVVCSELVAQSIGRRVRLPDVDVSDVEPLASLQHGCLEMIGKTLRAAMGPLRDKAGLMRAISQISAFAEYDDGALVAQMMLLGALEREESRGVHGRTDFPSRASVARHTGLTEEDVGNAIKSLLLPQELEDVGAFGMSFGPAPQAS